MLRGGAVPGRCKDCVPRTPGRRTPVAAAVWVCVVLWTVDLGLPGDTTARWEGRREDRPPALQGARRGVSRVPRVLLGASWVVGLGKRHRRRHPPHGPAAGPGVLGLLSSLTRRVAALLARRANGAAKQQHTRAAPLRPPSVAGAADGSALLGLRGHSGRGSKRARLRGCLRHAACARNVRPFLIPYLRLRVCVALCVWAMCHTFCVDVTQRRRRQAHCRRADLHAPGHHSSALVTHLSRCLHPPHTLLVFSISVAPPAASLGSAPCAGSGQRKPTAHHLPLRPSRRLCTHEQPWTGAGCRAGTCRGARGRSGLSGAAGGGHMRHATVPRRIPFCLRPSESAEALRHRSARHVTRGGRARPPWGPAQPAVVGWGCEPQPWLRPCLRVQPGVTCHLYTRRLDRA